jgi:uncharacterized Fe-S cluster-containing MiaB family protein
MTTTVAPPTVIRTELMEQLHTEANEDRPRLFAIYGVLRRIDDVLPEAPFVAWGMDFGDERGAIAWHPDDRSSHHSKNAVGVCRFYQRIGEARLVWLDRDHS